jgi:hypothetical protein
VLVNAGVFGECWLLKEPTVAGPPWRFLIHLDISVGGCWCEVLMGVSVGCWDVVV